MIYSTSTLSYSSTCWIIIFCRVSHVPDDYKKNNNNTVINSTVNFSVMLKWMSSFKFIYFSFKRAICIQLATKKTHGIVEKCNSKKFTRDGLISKLFELDKLDSKIVIVLRLSNFQLKILSLNAFQFMKIK